MSRIPAPVEPGGSSLAPRSPERVRVACIRDVAVEVGDESITDDRGRRACPGSSAPRSRAARPAGADRSRHGFVRGGIAGVQGFALREVAEQLAEDYGVRARRRRQRRRADQAARRSPGRIADDPSRTQETVIQVEYFAVLRAGGRRPRSARSSSAARATTATSSRRAPTSCSGVDRRQRHRVRPRFLDIRSATAQVAHGRPRTRSRSPSASWRKQAWPRAANAALGRRAPRRPSAAAASELWLMRRRDEQLLEFLRVMRRLRAECPGRRRRPTARWRATCSRRPTRPSRRSTPAISAHLREELGDLLLQVYFHAVIAEQAGDFTSTTSPATSSPRWSAATRTSSADGPTGRPGPPSGQRALGVGQGRRRSSAPRSPTASRRRCPRCSTPTRCSTGSRAPASRVGDATADDPDVWASGCSPSSPRRAASRRRPGAGAARRRTRGCSDAAADRATGPETAGLVGWRNHLGGDGVCAGQGGVTKDFGGVERDGVGI